MLILSQKRMCMVFHMYCVPYYYLKKDKLIVFVLICNDGSDVKVFKRLSHACIVQRNQHDKPPSVCQ